MPGAYAHLTMVRSLATRPAMERFQIHDEAIGAVQGFMKFCEFGAVSPDLPYLDFMSSPSKRWADRMHYLKTGDRLRAGANAIRWLTGDAREKAIAWLLGYTSHVITDVTIHPVVNLAVGGEYKGHEDEHRECEMHQDVEIYDSQGLGEIGEAEYLLEGGMGTCTDPDHPESVDPAVINVWERMLSVDDEGSSDSRDIDDWFKAFIAIVGRIASNGYKMAPWARHVGCNLNFLYPAKEDVNQAFVTDLNVPFPPGEKWPYEKVFQHAKEQVGKHWSIMSQAIYSGDSRTLEALRNWNLDTGKDENGVITMWR